jgi:hypothetical protein
MPKAYKKISGQEHYPNLKNLFTKQRRILAF